MEMLSNSKLNYYLIKKLVKENLLFKKWKQLLNEYKLKEYEIIKLDKIPKPKYYYGSAWVENPLLKYNKNYLNTIEGKEEILSTYLYNMKLRKQFLNSEKDDSIAYELFEYILEFISELNKEYNINNDLLEKYFKHLNNFISIDKEIKIKKEIKKEIISNIEFYFYNFPYFQNFVLNNLKHFKKITISFPSTITFEKWINLIDKMIDFVENYDDKKYKENKEIFVKYFFDLWI